MTERIEKLLDSIDVNPNIRELAERSGCSIDRLGFGEGHLEKFAELIVKECMSFCDETRSAYLKHRKASDDFTDKNIYAEGEAASDTIKYKMKKHFGVE